MRKEVKIGIIGIAAIAMLFLGINYLKGVRMFQPSSYYYVEYTDINGLAISSPVFASGYKIGLVRDIQYNHAHQRCIGRDHHLREGGADGDHGGTDEDLRQIEAAGDTGGAVHEPVTALDEQCKAHEKQ